MTMPDFPAQYSTSWYAYMQALDTKARAAPTAGYTDEQAQDAVAPMFTGGTHAGISYAYDDAGTKVNSTVDLTTLVDTTPITPTDLGLVAPQGARVYADTTAQTITNGAYPVYLDLNTVEYNENSGLFTVDLTLNKLTVLSGGLYMVSWDVGFADSAALREAYIAKNGGNAILAAAAGVGGQAGRTAPIRLAANDYLQVICYVEGSDVALVTNAPHRSGLGLYRIGL